MATLPETLQTISGKPYGLMTHVVAGFPDLTTTEKLVTALSEAGSDFIEIQFPFSDPMADGPTIMQANTEAVAKGVSTHDVMEMATRIAPQLSATLLVMTYSNIVFSYGVERFCKEAKVAGFAGVIIPDLPKEEAAHLGILEALRDSGLTWIPVLSPASTDARIEVNVTDKPPLVYLAAAKSTTGAGKGFDAVLKEHIALIKQHSPETKVAVGFGIKALADVEAVRALGADIVVAGSVLLQKLEEENDIAAVGEFVKSELAPQA